MLEIKNLLKKWFYKVTKVLDLGWTVVAVIFGIIFVVFMGSFFITEGISGLSVIFSCLFYTKPWSCSDLIRSPGYILLLVFLASILYIFLRWIYLEIKSTSEKSKEQARKYRIKASEGDAESQYSLAGMHLYGSGVKKNPEEGLEWLKIAANQGHTEAILLLGYMYQHGKWVKRDYEESLKWYQLVSKQVHYSHSEVFDGISNLAKQSLLALQYIEEMANSGLGHAQLTLGLMYYKGEGVGKDYVLAHMWLNFASDHDGYEFAIESKNIVEKKMTTSQIEKAQKWYEGHYNLATKVYEERDGLCTEYYENGNKWYEAHYKDGKKDGIKTMWDENGKLYYVKYFKGGRRDGRWIFLDNYGKKSTERYFWWWEFLNGRKSRLSD